MTILTDLSIKRDSTSKRGLLGRFKRDRRGSVAIEFSMLALPFSMLVFAILEASISFGAQQVMANSVDTVARSIRVATLKSADVSPATIRAKLCEQMSILVTSGCPGLEFDLKRYASFADVPTTIPRTPSGDVNTSGFTAVVVDGIEIHHLRAFYRWPYVSDFIGHKLAELPNGKTLLYASSTWRSEPPA